MDEATSMEPTLSGATYCAALERAEEYLSWEPWQMENLHCGWLSDHSMGTIKGGVLTLTWVGRTKLSVPVPYDLRDLLRELRQGKQLSLF